ncbi:hypothetical protein [Solibacillus sp. CAU 1738]|uniref:hypothetical protein n=1 Tax=Solibacillus sp. CAU 1738 TaxID=3140363 RepID=UPI0032601A28
MRKLLLACSVLLLASCTEKEQESVESETKIETAIDDQQEEQGQQEQSSITPNEPYNEQLSKVMADLANEFDFLPSTHTFYDYPFPLGLVYAELFDANADGQEELYVLLKSNTYLSDQLLHRSYPGYIQEIWQTNPDGDEATLLHYQLVKKDSSMEGQTSAVLNSGLKGREFTIDLKSAPQALSNVMHQLNTNRNSYSIEGETADGDALAQVEKVLNDLKMFRSIDIRNSKTYTSLATSLILYGLVENDAPYYSYFVGFKEDSIVEEMKNRFNITLSAADMNLPEPSEDDPSNFFTYKDGVFYIPPSDYYRDEVFRHIEQVVKVSDSVYYARLHDIRFDSLNYTTGIDDWNFDSSKYANAAIEDWPEETKPFLTQALPMYAVVKIVDGEAKLLYQGYLDLTDEELESF